MSKLELFFRFHPAFFREAIKEKSNYANIENYRNLAISLGLMGFVLAGILSYILPYSVNIRIIFFSLVGPSAYFFTPYMAISIAAERRRKEMERMLADALLLISTNLKSGASINRSFLASARDEFGPLEEELQQTAIEISGGRPIDEALENLRNRVNSELFKDTLKILSNAIKAGGNTAELMESSASDIRRSLELRDEIKSNIRMYTIFILMAAVFGAPLLFSITTYMAERTTAMWAETDLQSGGGGFATGGTGLSFQQPSVNPEFLVQFSIVILVISNFFSSLIISQIKNGNMKEGFKYVPFTISIAVAIFLTVKSSLTGLL